MVSDARIFGPKTIEEVLDDIAARPSKLGGYYPEFDSRTAKERIQDLEAKEMEGRWSELTIIPRFEFIATYLREPAKFRPGYFL